MTAVPSPVSAARFGGQASILADCRSTQDVVRAAAAQGAPEGFLAVCDHQAAGRGRLGRTWAAAPGQSLLLSLLLRPHTPVDRLAPLTLVAGIAVAESLPAACGLRWPNDVVVGGAKIAGILTELELSTAGTALVVLGVGVNVNVPAGRLPPTDRLPATSLLVERGAVVDRLDLLSRVVARIQAAYTDFETHGFEAFLDRYRALDVLLGRELTVRVADEALSGTGCGVDAAGRLVLALPGGRRSFDSAEVVRVVDVV